MFTLFKLLNPSREKTFTHQLIDEKRCVDLLDMLGAADVTELLEKGDTAAAREKTLSYIHSLLERGELKVRWNVQVQRPPQSEIEKKALQERIAQGTTAIFYTTIETRYYVSADDAITDIRRGWNQASKEDADTFERSIEFTLPTTEWKTFGTM